MFEAARRAILSLVARGEIQSGSKLVEQVRRIAVGFARDKNPVAAVRGFLDVAQAHEIEVASWLTPEQISKGERGAFEAADIRVWLWLAQKAAVPYVPAVEIVHLSDDEYGAVSGEIKLDNPLFRSVGKRLTSILKGEFGDTLPEIPESPVVDKEEVEDRLYAAMDDIPEGWMVRSTFCGSTELKSLAGTGLAGPEAPATRFGPELEIGPGWIRSGNRRRVHVTDSRTLELYVQGPCTGLTMVARPWITAARFFVSDDPHRHGSAFAGKGVWPGEWRAFAEGGVVTGVSSYYPWTMKASPENARIALSVRDAAQAIVDQALKEKLWPRFSTLEMARNSKKISQDLRDLISTKFARDTVSCTLDFIETANGIALLEGGPGSTPFGGGHGCAFTGVQRPDAPDAYPAYPYGVAFRLMPGVNLSDQSTWKETSKGECILSWEDVQHLACEPDRAESQTILRTGPALKIPEFKR